MRFQNAVFLTAALAAQQAVARPHGYGSGGYGDDSNGVSTVTEHRTTTVGSGTGPTPGGNGSPRVVTETLTTTVNGKPTTVTNTKTVNPTGGNNPGGNNNGPKTVTEVVTKTVDGAPKVVTQTRTITPGAEPTPGPGDNNGGDGDNNGGDGDNNGGDGDNNGGDGDNDGDNNGGSGPEVITEVVTQTVGGEQVVVTETHTITAGPSSPTDGPGGDNGNNNGGNGPKVVTETITKSEGGEAVTITQTRTVTPEPTGPTTRDDGSVVKVVDGETITIVKTVTAHPTYPTQAPPPPPPPACKKVQGLEFIAQGINDSNYPKATQDNWSLYNPAAFKKTPGLFAPGVTCASGWTANGPEAQTLQYAGQGPAIQTRYVNIQHRGYIYSATGGAYQVTIPAGNDNIVFFHQGAAAINYNKENASARYTLGQAAQTVTVNVPKGRAVPIRFSWGNTYGPGIFSIDIKDPSGKSCFCNAGPNTQADCFYTEVCDALPATSKFTAPLGNE